MHPERDMGKRIANNIASSNVLDYLELSDEHSIVEIIANKKNRWSFFNRIRYSCEVWIEYCSD